MTYVFRWISPILFLVVFSSFSLSAPPHPIPLWSDGAPGSKLRMNEPENVNREQGRCIVTNVCIAENYSLHTFAPISESCGIAIRGG